MTDLGPTRPVTLSDGSISVDIDPINGGRISSLRVDDDELLWTDADLHPTERAAIAWGMYPMAPFAGRIRTGRFTWRDQQQQLRINLAPHSIHGTVFDRAWHLDRTGDTAIEISTALGEHWPWAGRCVQRFELDDSTPGLLHTTIEVHSDGEAFPASAGWHPWFRTTTPSGARLSPFRPGLAGGLGRQVERGSDAIATGRWIPVSDSPWDDCFDGVDWPLTLEWRHDSGSVHALEISSDAPFAVVYDERVEAWCVEPQSAPPAVIDETIAEDLGAAMAIVEPGAPLVVDASWRVMTR